MLAAPSLWEYLKATEPTDGGSRLVLQTTTACTHLADWMTLYCISHLWLYPQVTKSPMYKVTATEEHTIEGSKASFRAGAGILALFPTSLPTTDIAIGIHTLVCQAEMQLKTFSPVFQAATANSSWLGLNVNIFCSFSSLIQSNTIPVGLLSMAV